MSLEGGIPAAVHGGPRGRWAHSGEGSGPRRWFVEVLGAAVDAELIERAPVLVADCLGCTGVAGPEVRRHHVADERLICGRCTQALASSPGWGSSGRHARRRQRRFMSAPGPPYALATDLSEARESIPFDRDALLRLIHQVRSLLS